MREMFVVTLQGTDRKGLVEAVARQIAAVDGNWEESKMARLAGQFAGILLVTIEPAGADKLVAALRALDGLHVTLQPVVAPAPIAACTTVLLEVTGADRPGIMRDVCGVLVEAHANIEELDSEIASAPMSGEQMFTARAHLKLPVGADVHALRSRLEAIPGELMVDLDVE